MSSPEDKNKSIFLQKLEEEERKLAQNGSKPLPGSKAKTDQKPTAERGGKHKKLNPISLFVTLFLLFIFIIVLLIFTLSLGGADNPVLQFFGQNENTIKDFLIRVVNGSFGSFSIILLITMTITLFFGFSRPKEEKQKRRISFLFAGASLALQFITILAWLGMFSFVNSLAVAPPVESATISLTLPDGNTYTPPLPVEVMNQISAPVDITFSAAEIEQNLTLRGKNIIGYRWDTSGYGDFQLETKSTELQKRIWNSGKQEISVKVLMNNNEELIKTIKFEIPRGSFIAEPDSGPIPLKVKFDASDVAKAYTGIQTFEWDFDNDGVTDETTAGPGTTHIFDKIGNYNVKLTMVDHSDRVYTFEREVISSKKPANVIFARIDTIPPIAAEDGVVLEIERGQEVRFLADRSKSASGDIEFYKWTFSDNRFEPSGKDVTRRFTDAGELEVKLLVRDEDNNEDTESIYVRVSQAPSKPEAVIKTKPPLEAKKTELIGIAPFDISFDASDSFDADNNIISYEWDIDGDETTDLTGHKVDYIYREPGTYNVRLIVTDSQENKSSTQLKVVVKKPDLTARIVARPETAEVPCSISFDGSLSSCADCNINGFQWDFGDGYTTPLIDAHVDHLYEQVGSFSVKLKIFTENDVAETTRNVFCRETALDACFSSRFLMGKAPLTTVFDPSCTKGAVQKWNWDFDDGSSSSDRIPSHTFRKPGKYDVGLTVTDDSNNIDKSILEIIVE